MRDRPPRALADGEVIDLGGKRVRQISTPHVPHGWEAQVLYDETTGTLLCGDLFGQIGRPAPLVTESVREAAMAAEAMFGATSLAPRTGEILRGLGDLKPTTLASCTARRSAATPGSSSTSWPTPTRT